MVTINPPTFADWPALLCLLHAAFAKMDGRINPPSSLLAMDSEDLCRKAAREDLFLIQRSDQPIGCLFARAETDAYCIGKLAVAPDRQGEGHARALIEAAANEAHRRALPALSLQTRVELTENHRAFRAMGFRLVGASAHPGHARATSFTFRRDLSPLPLSPTRAMP